MNKQKTPDDEEINEFNQALSMPKINVDESRE